MAERIHPAPELKNVHFPKYQQAIARMVREGLYDLATGWRPESRERILELMAENASPENERGAGRTTAEKSVTPESRTHEPATKLLKTS